MKRKIKDLKIEDGGVWKDRHKHSNFTMKFKNELLFDLCFGVNSSDDVEEHKNF